MDVFRLREGERSAFGELEHFGDSQIRRNVDSLPFLILEQYAE